MRSILQTLLLGLVAVMELLSGSAALAQANEKFVQVLVYRTAVRAERRALANGFIDYLNLVNERDGGVGGVKITYEVRDRLRDRPRRRMLRTAKAGPTGATAQPAVHRDTFPFHRKVPGDKIPLITMGYGRSESTDGSVFK
jgi:branched-chain amino acid transport system substrate-binding protein